MTTIDWILGFLFPLFPSDKLASNIWLKLSKYLCLILLLVVLGWSVYIQIDTEKSFLLKVLLIVFLSASFLLLINILSLFILGFTWLVRKLRRSKQINKINNKFWIILLFVVALDMFVYMVIQSYTSVILNKKQNYNSFYDFGYVVKMEGDWDSDKGLAEEVGKHLIECREQTRECEWISASIQQWNDNYFAIHKDIFPVVEWTDSLIRAQVDSDNRKEEIVIYRDNCKLVYIKSPIYQKGSSFTPDNVLLSITDTYGCK